MTHLCYTLEEAAEKLKLSETVLVRLSQYFKVPKAAYEEVGYLSFKGDLAFSDQDIAFFRRAKERLLTGESLDEVRHRVREDAPSASWQDEHPIAVVDDVPIGHNPELIEALPEAAMEATGPMREIQDRKPYENAAEKSFERYKSQHRTGLGKVFENMLKEVGGAVGGGKKRAVGSGAGYRPMRGKFDKSQQAGVARASAVRIDALQMPYVRDMVLASSGQGGTEHSWTHMIQAAANQPRSMNTQLKNAAQLLRDRAIGKPNREKTV